MRNSALSFIITSAASQFLGFFAGSIAMRYIPHELVGILVPSLAAFTFTRLASLPRSWQILNAIFPCALYLALSVHIPSWVFLAVLLFFATLHLPALWTRVPYYPTPHEIYKIILDELPRDKPFTFIDIGCGVGDLLLYLAQNRPQGSFYGVEVSLFPYCMSKLKSISSKNVAIEFKSFWSLNFSAYDVIYAFLSPAPMKQLWDKASKEMKQGAMLISNSFEAPTPASKVLGHEGKGTRVFLYYAK